MKRGFLNSTNKSKKPGSRHVPNAPVLVTQPEPLGKPEGGHDADITVDGQQFKMLPIDVPIDVGSTYAYTTLPTQNPGETLAERRDNWSECLFRGTKRKTEILSTPGFPTSIQRPPLIRHRIGPSSYGIGAFATSELKTSDLIFAERPLLVIPKALPRIVHPSSPANIPPTFLQASARFAEQEKILQVCLDRMIPKNRTAFLALHDCHTEDGSGPILGRARTNAIEIMDKKGIGLEDRIIGVFSELSRINHSCVPNATYRFDVTSFSCELIATRKIKKGEEISIGYCSFSVPKAERHASLKSYAFECTCRACSDPTSDALLAAVKEHAARMPQNLQEYESKDRAVHRGRLQESLEWMAKLEAIGWEALPEYSAHISAVIVSLQALGRAAESRKYEQMLLAWCKAAKFGDFVIPM